MTKPWARLREVMSSNSKVRRKSAAQKPDRPGPSHRHDSAPTFAIHSFRHQQQPLWHENGIFQETSGPLSALSKLSMNDIETMAYGDGSSTPTNLSGSTAYALSESMTEFDTECVSRDNFTPNMPSHLFKHETGNVPPKAAQDLWLAVMGPGFIDTDNNGKADTTTQVEVEPNLSCDEHIRPTRDSKCWPAGPSESDVQTPSNTDRLRPFASAKSLCTSYCTDSLLSDSISEDINWLIDLNNVCSILGSELPFFSVESEAIEDVVRAYQGQTTSEGESTGSPQPNSTTTGGVRLDTPKAAGKRPFEGDEPTAGNGEGPTIKSRRKQVCPGEARLSCPFQKRDPERYPLCGIRHSGYLTIAHVKQHLRRSHKRNPNYCPRCKTTFATEAQKNDHILQDFSVPCQERVSALPEGISPETEDALTRRVEQGSNLHDQWFSVWDMVFPGIPRPASCTFDLSSETHIQVLGLASYLESEGPAIVQSTLERHGLVVFSANPEHIESPSADVELYTRRVLSQAFRQLYESWQAQPPQPNSATSSGDFIITPPTGSSLQEGQNLPPTPISSSSHGEHVSQFPMPDQDISDGLGSAAARMASKENQRDGLQELPPLTDSDEAMMWLAYEDSSVAKPI